MKIKIEGLEIAFSENTVEEAAQRVAEQFGVLVELTGRQGGGGWPTCSLIGTPAAIVKALTSEGGWSSGDEEDDAESLFYFLKDAKQIFG